MKRKYLFTSESVSEGHPDKVADQISDSILDAYLEEDPRARVACETMVAKNLIVVGGEFRLKAKVAIPGIVKRTLENIGYTDGSCGLDYHTCRILISVSGQSINIANGIEHPDGELGAGDQGMMFGYATDETPELMPLPISLAHKLVQRQAQLRKTGIIRWFRPDAKAQVTVRYNGDRPVKVEKVVLSVQHSQQVTNDEIRMVVIKDIIESVIPEELRAGNIQYFINPAGRFEVGGPQADTGLTGRKIIVDTYGGSCPHGGGAFSVKDPTKIDRSGAYAARYIAKNIVGADLARRCTVILSYAIGQVEPISLTIDLHETGRIDERKLEDAIWHIFPLRPRDIIETLRLRRPIYRKTAAYGHFGRELPEFSWEKLDKTHDLNNYFNL
jgi:S-adenosylmethionine synthetase